MWSFSDGRQRRRVWPQETRQIQTGAKWLRPIQRERREAERWLERQVTVIDIDNFINLNKMKLKVTTECSCTLPSSRLWWSCGQPSDITCLNNWQSNCWKDILKKYFSREETPVWILCVFVLWSTAVLMLYCIVIIIKCTFCRSIIVIINSITEADPRCWCHLLGGIHRFNLFFRAVSDGRVDLKHEFCA